MRRIFFALALSSASRNKDYSTRGIRVLHEARPAKSLCKEAETFMRFKNNNDNAVNIEEDSDDDQWKKGG